MNQLFRGLLLSFLAGAAGAVVVAMLWARHPALFSRFEQPLSPASNQQLSRPGETADVGAARAYEAAIIQAVEKANPAVVSIVISKDVAVLEQFYEGGPSPFSNPFDSLFESPFSFRFPAPQLRQRGTERLEIGGGSGFLISNDGFIVTNKHVVSQEGATYTVLLNDGRKFEAKIVARDPVTDIAVLRISASGLPFLEFGDSDQLRVGQTVISIGNALAEFRNTVSVGVVSALSRSIVAGDSVGQAEQLDEVIQTDAAINPGNSGGPLLDLNGQIVGVNVAMALGSENIGFALPANAVKSIVTSVRETGKIVRPFLGVRYVPVTPALKTKLQLPVDYGVLVVRGDDPEEVAVAPGSAADKAGIKENDIILEFDGKRLDQAASLASFIGRKQAGDTVSLKILSQGQERTVSVTLGKIE